MTEEQLAKLAVAREKALVVRRQQKAEKLKAEAARLEATQVEPNETVFADGVCFVMLAGLCERHLPKRIAHVYLKLFHISIRKQ